MVLPCAGTSQVPALVDVHPATCLLSHLFVAGHLSRLSKTPSLFSGMSLTRGGAPHQDPSGRDICSHLKPALCSGDCRRLQAHCPALGFWNEAPGEHARAHMHRPQQPHSPVASRALLIARASRLSLGAHLPSRTFCACLPLHLEPRLLVQSMFNFFCCRAAAGSGSLSRRRPAAQQVPPRARTPTACGRGVVADKCK